MPSFLDRLLGRTQPKNSGTTAKERLQFILVHDRINLPPERMQAMKEEILAVISKYVSVDGDKVDIELQKRDRSSMLVAEIPFYKTHEGIEQDDDDVDESTADSPTDAAASASDDSPAPEARAETRVTRRRRNKPRNQTNPPE